MEEVPCCMVQKSTPKEVVMQQLLIGGFDNVYLGCRILSMTLMSSRGLIFLLGLLVDILRLVAS
jgi:hypothetical protein